jgi:peptidyl-prolyl cis-trans isomerase D
MSAPLRAKKSNKTMALILVGMLVVSLAGFGVSSIGSGGRQAVATVGTQEVTVDAYIRTLNSQVRAMSQQIGQSLSLNQARTYGVDRQVIAQVLIEAAMDGESKRIGLSVGDDQVKKTLLKTRAFQGLTGAFDETTYKAALQQAGLKPAQYDVILRNDSTRRILQTAVIGGINGGDTYASALLKYLGETRDLRWAIIGTDMLPTPTREPTAAEIEAEYKAKPETYTAPKKRQITYVVLTPDMLIKSMKPDDVTLKAAYDSQPERFHTPARRIADRLVFGSTEEATAALASIRSGDKTFKDVVTARGLTVADISLGEIAKSDLGDQASKAVFALGKPGLVGPVDSALGPAIFRVNAIIKEINQSFASVRDVLQAEAASVEATQQIDSQITKIDDLLAGGATLEDIAAETDLALKKMDFVKGKNDGIGADTAFQKAASDAKPDGYAEVLSLENGGIFALRLDKIIEPTLIPLADIKDQVAANWKKSETRKSLLALADKIKSQLDGGENFEAVAVNPTTETGLRRATPINNAPIGLGAKVFDLKLRDVAVVSDKDKIAIVRLTAITPFDPTDPANAAVIDNVKQQFSAQIGSDVLVAYTNALEDSAGVSINQNIINAIYAQNGGRLPGSSH